MLWWSWFMYVVGGGAVVLALAHWNGQVRKRRAREGMPRQVTAGRNIS